MRTIKNRLALLLALLLFAAPLRASDLLVFGAASLSDALKELGSTYQKETGTKVAFNFAGSNLLARQIMEGAPADVFASADEAQMDRLEAGGLLETKTRRVLLSNLLVAVALADSPLSVRSAAGLASPAISRIAIADPRAVPSGVYARKYLEKAGLWSRLIGKVLPTENVRGALQAVESGNAEVAMVYKSDALISKKVRILFEVPREEGPRIAYPFAVLKDAPGAEPARRFLDFLSTDASMQVFLRHGFLKPAGA